MTTTDERATFVEHFWEARKLYTSGHKDEALAAYHALADKARAAGHLGEADLAEAAMLEINEEYTAALARIESLPPVIHETGLPSYLQGSVYASAKQYAKAITAFQVALDTPLFSRQGYAWNNMGNAYDEMGDYAEAIRCFQHALDDSTYDTPGNAWYNMGYVYNEMGDYAEAIRCYQHALDEPTFDTPGKAWNNMGVVHHASGDHAEAIRCYQHALDDTPGDAWYNMGVAYGKSGDHAGAINCYRKAEQWYSSQGCADDAALARKLRMALEVHPEERSAEDTAFLDETTKATTQADADDPETRMWKRIASAEQTAYKKYDEQPLSDIEKEADVLAILKGWGSATPIIQEHKGGSRGGGYFLRWQGKGLVIDPGFDFLRNFHEVGWHGRNIDAVAITHAHTDHCQDLPLIEDLFYEMSKNLDADGKPTWRYTLLADQDTCEHHRHLLVETSYRYEPLHFDTALLAHRAYKPHRLHTHPNNRLPFVLDFFKSQHGEDVPHSVGLRITCRPSKGKSSITIGYSSDTGFFDELCDEKHLGGVDILIADVSQPDKKEKADGEHLKRSHLGLNGLRRLIEGCKPRITIISEFWSGLADVRLEMAKELRDQFKSDGIFPGGVGLFLRPTDWTIRCTSCGKFRPYAEIATARVRNDYGPLAYLCQGCRT